MTERRNEELELQDYLDGRLPEEERERFESRLEREPELARRLAAAREIGDSLREADEELSPGFYTRARAAFEEASQGRETRPWFRPLSWETAGLVAVVAVAAVLFVPALFRAPSVRDAFTEPPLDEKAAVRWVELEEEVAAGDVVDDELAAQEAPPEPQVAPALQETGRGGAVAGAAAPPEPGDRLRSEATPLELEGLGHVGEKKELPPADATRDKGEDREVEKEWAPVPPAKARVDQAAPPPPAREAKRQPSRETEEAYTEADAAQYSKQDVMALDGLGSDGPAAVALPSGLAEAGALVVVDDPEEWQTLLAGPAGRALADLGGYDPLSRLVLIGARPEPFDCAILSVVATDARYWILLSPPAEGGRAAEHGCALLLPRDGRTIEIGPGAAD